MLQLQLQLLLLLSLYCCCGCCSAGVCSGFLATILTPPQCPPANSAAMAA